MGIKLLNGQQRQTGVRASKRQCRAPTIDPALVNAVQHRLRAFGRKRGEAGRVIAQVTRVHVNGAAATEATEGSRGYGNQPREDRHFFHVRYATPGPETQQARRKVWL